MLYKSKQSLYNESQTLLTDYNSDAIHKYKR